MTRIPMWAPSGERSYVNASVHPVLYFCSAFQIIFVHFQAKYACICGMPIHLMRRMCWDITPTWRICGYDDINAVIIPPSLYFWLWREFLICVCFVCWHFVLWKMGRFRILMFKSIGVRNHDYAARLAGYTTFLSCACRNIIVRIFSWYGMIPFRLLMVFRSICRRPCHATFLRVLCTSINEYALAYYVHVLLT